MCPSPKFSSVTQSCPTLCSPMDCSTPGFPVHHQLPELAQTHVHWVGDAIQPTYPLSSPSLPVFNLSQHQGLFQWVSSLHQVAQSIGVSASAAVLPMNIQDWFPLRLRGFDLLAVQGALKSFLQHLKGRGNRVHIPYITQYTQPGLRPTLQFKKVDIPVAKCLEIHVKGEYKKCKWILFSRDHVCCCFSFGANLKKKAFHWQELYGFSIARNVCQLVPEESDVLFSAWPYQTSSEPRAGRNKQPWPPSSQGFKAERGSDHDVHGTQIHEYLQVFSFSLFWKTEEQGAVGNLSHTPWLKNGRKGSLVEQHLRQILCFSIP